ncbi:MAG: hypothetical protein H6Q90_2381 [Deltaproteobacteria bacterium]|nr:hypothetical protein [Deltaproteobacteria bacterium]
MVVTTWALTGTSVASPVVGKIELPPPPDRPVATTKGFLDRVENPNKPVRPVDVGPYLLVVLENDTKPASPGQVTWELVGDSFNRPVIGVPVGAEVVIKNVSKTARTLAAAEDPKVVPAEPINPTGSKAFRVGQPNVYTVSDKDAPHLKGKLVVVNTSYVSNVEVTNNVGRFELADVPEGTYKVRIFYRDNWLDRPDDTVTVPAKAKVKTEVNVKVISLATKK